MGLGYKSLLARGSANAPATSESIEAQGARQRGDEQPASYHAATGAASLVRLSIKGTGDHVVAGSHLAIRCNGRATLRMGPSAE